MAPPAASVWYPSGSGGRNERVTFSMIPQEGEFWGTRSGVIKETAASARITAPKPMENTTMIGAAMLGRIWNTMVRRSVAPITRAASTNGCSRADSTTPLTMRWTLVMPTNPRPRASTVRLGGRNDISRISISSAGNAWKESISRWSIVSNQPRK